MDTEGSGVDLSPRAVQIRLVRLLCRTELMAVGSLLVDRLVFCNNGEFKRDV